MNGIFVVVEGPNRAGKSTLVQEFRGLAGMVTGEVLVTREPGGTPLGEGLRAVLKDATMSGGSFATALVFNGARKEHADRVITPALQRGALVVCDRYYASTEIFQGLLANDIRDNEMGILRSIHASFPQPHLTVFLLPGPEVIMERGKGPERDRFEGNARELEAYEDYAREFAKTHPTMIMRPTRGQGPCAVFSEIMRHPVFEKLVRKPANG